jgi:GMP reductase
MNKFLNYRDVALVPGLGVLRSRSEASTSINFLGKLYRMPVVPANMASVIDDKIARILAHNYYFYIMHRFCDVFSFVETANKEAWPLISISVGVKKEDIELLKKIKVHGYHVDVVTIDIAHGYSILIDEMIEYIKNLLPNTKIVAGNIWGNAESIQFLQAAGVDAIKIGLSMGKSCRTFPETGFGSPMFSAAMEAGKYSSVPVIIDGGVRENGDVAKAMVAFLSSKRPSTEMYYPMIMTGGVFAECLDAPGETIVDEDGKKYKKFYGSASSENKKNTGQEIKHVEGKTILLNCNNLTCVEKMKEMMGALQSSISYAGGGDLSAFMNVDWGIISSNS